MQVRKFSDQKKFNLVQFDQDITFLQNCSYADHNSTICFHTLSMHVYCTLYILYIAQHAHMMGMDMLSLCLQVVIICLAKPTKIFTLVI